MDRVSDKTVVVRRLRKVYGSEGLQWPLDGLAEEIVGWLAAAGRLGDAAREDEDWVPSTDDVDDFGGPLANSHGEMRQWRADEIGYEALRALGIAGRLLPRPAPMPDPMRAVWRADLERLAEEVGRPLASWQLDVAAALFVEELPYASVTGAMDISVAAQHAGRLVADEMRADGRLDRLSGNWPSGHPRVQEYYAHYFPHTQPREGS